MPARRGLLSFFRQCLWRSRLGRLCVQTRGRLRRGPVGSVLDGDGTCISRGGLSDTGGGLIGRARRLLLTGHDTGGDLVDGARYLLLTSGDPVDALPYRVDIERHCVELLIEGRRD